ncbi:hypothetical protein [Butyricimonas paravirosa]
MKKVACVIIFWLTASLLIGGCSRDVKVDAGEEVLVNLDISVALSDVAQSMTRGVEEDAMAKGDHEKMQKLRVIVVRENDVVEKNDFIGPLSSDMNGRVSGQFEVVGREWKRIYLFVNEDNKQIKVGQGDSDDALTLASFLDNIKVGEIFPTEEIANLTVRVDKPSGQLVGALPMSECHQVYVPKTDSECALFVTRAAVKFTFRITNKSSVEKELTGLVIKNMADKEYYLPRNAKYENENIEGKEYLTIKSFDVPSFVTEYDFNDDLEVALPAMKEGETLTPTELSPIYLLEGKREGKYSVGITVNGAYLEGELDNLPDKLPRNTHVVVYITITDKELEFEVNVEPYREVELKPDFGL